MASIKLIGSKFNKINATKNPDFEGKVTMSTQVKVLSIERVKDVKDSLDICYSFEVDFSDLGKIEIEGNIFIKTDPRTLKDLLKSWENKKFDSEEHVALTNFIIQKASIRAFSLEDELGLPTHIKMPALQVKK